METSSNDPNNNPSMRPSASEEDYATKPQRPDDPRFDQWRQGNVGTPIDFSGLDDDDDDDPELSGSSITRRVNVDDDLDDDPTKMGPARFNQRTILNLTLKDFEVSFRFFYDDIDQIVIGRSDPVTGSIPDVDLASYDALNKGVSRSHALIVRREGSLNLVDQGSPNGTFLNGQKLIPQQPRILRDGDDVRLGHLALHVAFQRINTSAL